MLSQLMSKVMGGLGRIIRNGFYILFTQSRMVCKKMGGNYIIKRVNAYIFKLIKCFAQLGKVGPLCPGKCTNELYNIGN